MTRLSLLALAAMSAQQPASAPATRPAGDLLAFVQRKAEGLAGLEADLTLRETVAQLEEPIVSRGSMVLDRRGRLRVEIREPRRSLLLARGERIEVYRGEAEKPEFSGVDPSGASVLLPLLGLPDAAAIEKIWQRFELAEEGGGSTRALRLKPRSPDDPLARSVRELRFEVGAEDGLPRAFEWIGRTGDSTRYEMASVRPLAKVDASRFERP
ncbi:MAG: outer membrane lipoprotein carrier protein LolA [Planctomycetes bacterium]|nr:outer membrane lipoprotein carrier protein LolA [Planctomycetota bacterium]